MLTSLHEMIADYDMRLHGVLHIGAHIGEEAMAYHDAAIRDVLWVEANRDIIDTLTANVAPYGHRVANYAITDTDNDIVKLHVTNNIMSSSLLPLGTHKLRAPQVDYTHDVYATSRRIDTLCTEQNFHDFNLLEMDIQGAELMAVRGAVNELRHVEWIFTEINFDELYVGCARAWQLDEFLWAQGFYRCETWMAGNDVGWGDALYARRNYVR